MELSERYMQKFEEEGEKVRGPFARPCQVLLSLRKNSDKVYSSCKELA